MGFRSLKYALSEPGPGGLPIRRLATWTESARSGSLCRMKIVRPASLAEFVDLAAPFLSRHEAEHGLMLGVAMAAPTPAADAYWGLAIDGSSVAAAALRTDTKLILSREGAPGAIAALAADAASARNQQILGPAASVDRFAIATGHPWSAVMSQGIYECRDVVVPSSVPGIRRLARAEDRELLSEWLRRLASEALGEEVTGEDAIGRVDGHMSRCSLHVWDGGGRAVAVAAAVAPTPHGIRINNVYTPPELRGRGYAGALVAALTQNVLDSGRQFAFLHTDLSNPTSNALYVRIGYRRVAELQVRRPGGEANQEEAAKLS